MNYTCGGLYKRKIIHEGRPICEVTITDMSLEKKKPNKFEVAMHLYSNRSQ